MSTAVTIIARLDGTDQVNAGLRSMGNTATEIQRRIDRTVGVGRGADTGGLLSAQGAAAQMQDRINNDLLRDRGLQLEKMRNGFKVAGDEGGRFAGRLGEISNQTAMLGGRLLGIDPMLVRLGGRFGVFGLAAAAGLSVLNKSIEAVRSNLEALELKDPGKLGTLFNVLTNSPFERDTEATRARRGTESETRLGAFDRSLQEPDWYKEWQQKVKSFEQDTGEKLTPDALRNWYESAKEAGEFQQKLDEQGARNQEFQNRRYTAGLRIKAEADELARKEGAAMLQEAERIKEIAGRRDAEEGRQRLEDRQTTLRPWMDEAKNPKGFAETTLSNSLEGVRAVAEAATAGERRDATLSAMQDQIRLLQDIRTNTGNANQPVTVGAL